MKPVDAHCHLGDSELKAFRENLREGEIGDIDFIVDTGMDPESNHAALETRKESEQVVASVGLHPTRTEKFDSVDRVVRQIREEQPAAVGEVGLDYHHVTEKEERGRQEVVFQELVGVAEGEGLPLVVHSRNAEQRTIEILQEFSGDVFLHCFNGRPKLVDKAVQEDYFIGVTPQVKWSSRAREVAENTPLNSMLLETDSPFIGENPNDVWDVAGEVSELKGVDVEEVLESTTENARKLFAKSL